MFGFLRFVGFVPVIFFLTGLPFRVWGAARPANVDDVLTVYADIASAAYEDALVGARELEEAVAELVSRPTESSLNSARDAWISARIPYSQTEVFRFGNPVVDAWEPRVNAWPLDEGFIDYVKDDWICESAQADNVFCHANVISRERIDLDGREVDLSSITPELIAGVLHEMGGIELNVASGYHAIEFLLWGQDPGGKSSGQRPATDFDVHNCTGGHCERRRAYLQAVVRLLVLDLQEMVAHWKEGGAAREFVMKDSMTGLRAMLAGMSVLSYVELAGARIRLGLLLHDPEEEQDCFSDNTHASHYYAMLGVRNVYLGRYVRTGGEVVEGPSLSDLLKDSSPVLDVRLRAALDASMDAMQGIVAHAMAIEHYDQMIAEGNAEGNALVGLASDRLVEHSALIEDAAVALGMDPLGVTGGSSSMELDSRGDVF